MDTDLFDLCESVVDEKSFLVFLKALMEDRNTEVSLEKENPSSPYDAGALGWQNTSIEDFLESAVAWAKDSEGAPEQFTQPNNPWGRAAQIIHAGKTYE